MKFGDFVTAAEAFFGKAIHDLDIFVEGAAPIAAAVGTMTGNPEVTMAANAAGVIATATDKAITAHEAAGSTPQSAAAAAVSIAQAVASSGVVDSATAVKIQQITSSVAAISPEIMRAITEGP